MKIISNTRWTNHIIPTLYDIYGHVYPVRIIQYIAIWQKATISKILHLNSYASWVILFKIFR